MSQLKLFRANKLGIKGAVNELSSDLPFHISQLIIFKCSSPHAAKGRNLEN